MSLRFPVCIFSNKDIIKKNWITVKFSLFHPGKFHVVRNGFVTRECGPDGQWLTVNSSRTWRDHSQCDADSRQQIAQVREILQIFYKYLKILWLFLNTEFRATLQSVWRERPEVALSHHAFVIQEVEQLASLHACEMFVCICEHPL